LRAGPLYCSMWCYSCCCVAPSSKGCAVQCYKHPDLIISTMALWFTMVYHLALGSRVWFCWCCRTPRMWWNNKENQRNISRAKNEQLDSWLCQRMCDVSTKQESDASKESPFIQDYHLTWCLTISTNRYGSDHGTTSQKWQRCYSHNSRPQMLTCSNIPSMYNNHHRTWNCPTILTQCLLMVWITR